MEGWLKSPERTSRPTPARRLGGVGRAPVDSNRRLTRQKTTDLALGSGPCNFIGAARERGRNEKNRPSEQVAIRSGRAAGLVLTRVSERLTLEKLPRNGQRAPRVGDCEVVGERCVGVV